MTHMLTQTLFPELVAHANTLLDSPGLAQEEALALAIEAALDQGDNAALGHAVLSAAAQGRPGLAERLASRLITHSSRWTLPGAPDGTVSLTAMAVPLLVRHGSVPTFDTTAAITALADSFVASTLFPAGSRVMLLPYLYSMTEMLQIGFCHGEEIAFSLAARPDGVLPPREDVADFYMTGGDTPSLDGGWHLHWILGVLIADNTPPPPWLLAISDPEVDFTCATDRALLSALAPTLRTWQTQCAALELFGADVSYAPGLPCLLSAAMPRIALYTGLLQLDTQMAVLDAESWDVARSDISWELRETHEPGAQTPLHVEVLGIALQGPLRTVAQADFMLSAFLSAGAVDALYGCLLSGRGHGALYARTRRFSLDTHVAPLGSLLN